MSELLTHRSTVSPDSVEEKARRAVSAFRALQPTLTTYARILSGNQRIRVDMAATDNGSTDGERIYFRPPIALGDSTPHVRRDCDKRDERGLMICLACAIREEVLVTIYHEIAHVCFESFARTSDQDKRRAIEFAAKEAKGPWAQQIVDRIKNAPPQLTGSYMGLCQLINEYLPFLLNCMEDARVNRELFKARKGVKRMFAADTQKIFDEGFEAVRDGQIVQARWQEAPLNSQAMIGIFVKASGYDYSDWLHPKVVEDLNDQQLTSLVRELDTARSANAVYNLSFRVLARLRDLGYCGTPQDPDPEPEPEPEEQSDESEAEESSQGDSESGDGVPDVEPDNSSSGTGGRDTTNQEEDPESGSGQQDDPRPEGELDESDSMDSSDGNGDADPSSGSGSGSNEQGEGEVDGTGTGLEERSDPQEGESAPDLRSEDASSGSPEAGDQPERDSSSGGSPSEGDPSSEQDGGDSSPSGSSGEMDLPERESSAETGNELPQDTDSQDDASDVSSNMGDTGESESSGGMADQRGDEDNLIDTGADDGYGGTEVINENYVEPEMGTPDEVDPILLKWNKHEEKPKSMLEQQAEDAANEAVDKAIIQGLYFTKPSSTIWGVREHYYGKPVIIGSTDTSRGWIKRRDASSAIIRGQGIPIELDEAILQPALMRLRRIFTDNKRGKLDSNRKSGRVNASVLGKRAWNHDPRLFSKKTLPGKKDYFVVIGLDISGSTTGTNLMLEKRAVFAKAELLDRLGIPFAVFGHTGSKVGQHSLDMYHIKDEHEPWNEHIKERLVQLGPASANLDGHALEYLRKVADKSKATDKIIMYYSDGKMPLENYNEELEILQREIKLCDKKGYTLLGVGIRTDSPRAHGLDTVEVHGDDDLGKVVAHLESRLSVAVSRR